MPLIIAVVMLYVDDIEDVLNEPRYWSGAFCRQFLDSFGEQTLEDPQLGRRWAEIGLELVSRVEETRGVKQPVLRARAMTVLGVSFRAIGDTERADQVYGEALKLYRKLSAPLDRADLRRRIAYLRIDQRRFDEALDELEAARDVFQAAGDEERHGLVLMVIGHVYQEQGDTDKALVRLVKALPKLEKSARAKAKQVLMHNVVGTLAASPDLDASTVDEAIELVRKSRAKRGDRYGHRVCTLSDAKARWVLGLLYWRIPKRRPRAIEVLESSREDLASLGSPLDVAVLSLNLGEMYAHKKRWRELETMAAESLQLLERIPGSAEAIAAYQRWRQAVTARDAERLVELAEPCRAKLACVSRIPGST
ncbi:MAG: tetratricopeptide repeat protein [bacterium]|nr:tetratricopeptide repeat protein [bacterium]